MRRSSNGKQLNTTEGGRYHFYFIYCEQDGIVPGKQLMDTAFSYDYSRLVLGKRIIQDTFSNSKQLTQSHYKLQPQILLRQIEESIGYKAMLQYPSALIKH